MSDWLLKCSSPPRAEHHVRSFVRSKRWTAQEDRVLPGVGRALIVDAARRRGLRVRFEAPRRDAAREWTEVFFTNARVLLSPAARVSDRGEVLFHAPGDCSMGEVSRALRAEALALLGSEAWSEPLQAADSQ